MQKQQVRLVAGRRHLLAIETVIGDILRQRIRERLGEQLTHPFQRMLVTRHGVASVIEACGDGLTRGLPVNPATEP